LETIIMSVDQDLDSKNQFILGEMNLKPAKLRVVEGFLLSSET
jgi:hypothetical protein